MTLAAAHLDLLLANALENPYTVLGLHPHPEQSGNRAIVRVYRPDADAVAVLVDGETYLAQPVGHPHVFEAEVPRPVPFAYELQLTGGRGSDRVIHDPYGFPELPLTEFDRHLFGEGTHYQIYEKLGAHPITVEGVAGVYFAVWAPNARNVSVLSDWNGWDGRIHQMRKGPPGIWEIFVPGASAGLHYKYEIKNHSGHIYEKTDPYGFQQEIRPKTASIVADLRNYTWQDQDWLAQRAATNPLTQPISVYEVHLGSWLHDGMDNPPADGYPAVAAADLKPGARFLTYRELADKLIPYVKELGFTHLELLPVAEHPYDGSWGYQVVGFYAVTSRYGTPEDFMYFVDRCHQAGLGVIIDWVPGHFPRDGHGLAFFDGTHLYEYADPRIGEHKQWGTLVFNYSRHEVKNFLIANVLFWFEKFHIDGIRVDAVASMLYLDYLRPTGEWLPNKYGGREHLAAIELFRHLHSVLFEKYPGALSIAEESTAWPMITWPAYAGGLGFNLKWNMGWMHDMLDYFAMDPWFRQFHQQRVTFSIWYAFSENFMLALSHDEVVHGKSPMPGKIPGDEWQKFASLRCLYGYMFCHPGKKTLFMGMEFGQTSEWNVWDDLDWHLMQYPSHQTLKLFMQDLHKLYKSQPALYEVDFKLEGFQWIECDDNRNSVISFLRKAADGSFLVVVCNFTPVLHASYRIGVPEPGFYAELLNSDAQQYNGSGTGNLGGKWSEDWGCHGFPYSLYLCVPPLAILVLQLQPETPAIAEG